MYYQWIIIPMLGYLKISSLILDSFVIKGEVKKSRYTGKKTLR